MAVLRSTTSAISNSASGAIQRANIVGIGGVQDSSMICSVSYDRRCFQSVCDGNFSKKRSNKSPKAALKPRRGLGLVRAIVTEVVKEGFLADDVSRSFRRILAANCGVSTVSAPLPNRADDMSLGYPMNGGSQKSMGYGLFAVIMEWEGVIVEDDTHVEHKAWLALAQEEGESPPVPMYLKKVEGMKSEQAISEVLCWTRDPLHVRRLALRKEELYHQMRGEYHMLLSGSEDFVYTLKRYNIPTALATVRPRKYIEKALEAVGFKGVFDVVITAEDITRGKPDPEIFLCAARLLNFKSDRCIVFGSSNTSVEAAHNIYMKCVAVASKHPVFELGAADMVVTRLDELSILDLKKLADIESPEFQPPPADTELEN